jgi:signal transduction histidine kinase
LPLARGDEIGLVAREFSRLLSALEEAERKREREEALRREAERTLEHADKLITVGRLSARFAHEIGSPLQVLVGRAQAISESPEASDKVKRHATLIAEQGHRIVQIVRDLLAWTRPPGAPVPTRVQAEVRAITTLLELEAKRRNVALRERFDAAEDLVVACRRGQIQQVVFNLVKNALAATPEGGEVVVAIRREGDELVLGVEDSGPGIPPEVLARLFEPFFSTRLDDGGIGLGLTVVRGIVDEHGGKVEVFSREGGGSRFVVRWPLFEVGRERAPEGAG